MKRIVICADGTWNRPDQKLDGKAVPTNVAKLAFAINANGDDGTVQVPCYHSGLGTGNFLDRILGGAFGEGLDKNIQDLYVFLVANYSPGDQIWLFGFSRGAYTVRSLSGLIRNSGVLKRENYTRIGQAYKLYRNRVPDSHPRAEKSIRFREKYCHQEITTTYFIGVWDTVGSLGIPSSIIPSWSMKKYEFHDVKLSRFVLHAYQALSVDEKRKAFMPTLWEPQEDAPPNQKLEQAWFAGDHCGVGGGWPESGLSDCALMWMVDRATKAGLAVNKAQIPIGDPNGKLNTHTPIFYKFLGQKIRTVGKVKNGMEGLHKSVIDRENYHPKNLDKIRHGNPVIYQ